MYPEPCTRPPHVSAEDGVVTIEGQCGTIFALTVDVAMQMSQQLIRSAARARGQTRMTQPRLFRD